VMGEPTIEVVTAFAIENAAWLIPVKVKTTALEFAALKFLSAALVATTEQLVGWVALSAFVFAVITQPAPVALKLKAPVPEPPVAVSTIDVPTVVLCTELVMMRGACDAADAPGTNATAANVMALIVAASDFVTRAYERRRPLVIMIAVKAIPSRMTAVVMYSPYVLSYMLKWTIPSRCRRFQTARG